MALFSIDREEFNIPLVALKRESAVLDKYATRTEGGDLKREIIGVYYNYTLTFPNLNLNQTEYDRLWKKVTEPVEFHDFVVPSSSGTFSFRGYITTTGDELKRSQNGRHYWGGLSIKLIAKAPARLPKGV